MKKIDLPISELFDAAVTASAYSANKMNNIIKAKVKSLSCR